MAGHDPVTLLRGRKPTRNRAIDDKRLLTAVAPLWLNEWVGFGVWTRAKPASVDGEIDIDEKRCHL
jgi:hypothetical protein